MSESIYLIQIFSDNPKKVYKIGRTSRDFSDRFREYKNTCPSTISVRPCIDSKNAEKDLLMIFKSTFTRRSDLGNEYFEGNVHKMDKAIEKYFASIPPIDHFNDQNTFREIPPREPYNIVPYTCPRCKYTTIIRQNMYKHINRRTICPSVNGHIELTDDVKNIILTERIYHPPKSKAVQMFNNVNVNQNNQMFFSNLSTVHLLDCYNKYNHLSRVPFCNSLQCFLEDKCIELNGQEKTVELFIDDILQMIDHITCVDHTLYENINLFYDAIEDKIHYFDIDGWVSHLAHKGIKSVLEKIQKLYFDNYECYLIKRIVSLPKNHEQQFLLERITEFYKFLLTFNLVPYCCNQYGNALLPNIDTSQTDLYTRAKQDMRQTEKNKIHKRLMDVIIRKSDVKIRSFKSHMFNLFCNDNSFKDFVRTTHHST